MMGLRALLVAALGALLALPVAAIAKNGPVVYQVSGGGQVIAGTENNGIGAGHTVAFTAQLTEADDVRGQFRYIDRTAGAGQQQSKHFGVVTCIVPVNGDAARFGGELRDGSDFVVDVSDTGPPSMGADMIVIRTGEDAEDRCDAEGPDDGDFVALARGNVTIHDRR